MKFLYILLALVSLMLIYSVSAVTIQEGMTSTAQECPGVGRVVVVQDNAHIGVTITPGEYATSSDLANAVATLIMTYSEILTAIPDYNGYLRVGIANKAWDNQYRIVQIFEAPAQETRANANQITEYANYILGKGKKVTYTYLVQGYPVTWPEN